MLYVNYEHCLLMWGVGQSPWLVKTLQSRDTEFTTRGITARAMCSSAGSVTVAMCYTCVYWCIPKQLVPNGAIKSKALLLTSSSGPSLTLMLLVANFANIKWCKNLEKCLKPWHMGTYLSVCNESYPMNTKMTGFRWFLKGLASLCFRRKKPQH